MQALAAVVTLSGSPQMEGKRVSLREVFDPNAVKFHQGYQDDIGIVLGNQISVHAMEGARWEIEQLSGNLRFRDTLPWERETTRSQTIIRVRQGSFAFRADHLNDESTFTIKTHLGDLRVQRATGVVKVFSGFVMVGIESGQVYFENEYTQNPLMISEGRCIELSDTSAIRLNSLSRKTWEQDPIHVRQIEIARANAKRVYFTQNSNNATLLGTDLTDVVWITPERKQNQ